MLIGVPTASIGSAFPTVWSDVRLFVDYKKRVISCEVPCKVDIDSLIFDTHESHLSIPAINVTKEYVIFVLTLHPIHHISYSHWIALFLIHIKHITMHTLMIGCCQT